VKLSPELAVIKTISSLAVSGSIATVNWSTLPAARDTPPRSPAAVPDATDKVVAEFVRRDDSVVSIETEEYRRVIGFPYRL
jgi:hypothetical protein